MEKKAKQYDVVIIGGNAAGLTVAIYCRRIRLKTLVIEKALADGLAVYTNEIENYPGFSEGNTGFGLMKLFHKQARRFGVKSEFTDVRVVQPERDTKVMETFCTNYEYRSVIIASDGKLGLTGAPGGDKFLYDKGTFFCATCDAAANTGKTVTVTGSGDVAIEEGVFLTKFASKVIVGVTHEEGKMDYNEIVKEEILTNSKVESIWNTLPEEFRGDEEHLHSMALKNLKISEVINVPVDTCFLFIDYVPNTEIFKGITDINRSGYMLTNERMETNIPDVFAAGDVYDKFLKQTATAVGDGVVAGCAAEKYLAESEVFENQIIDPSFPGLMHIRDAVETTSCGLLPVTEEFEQERGRSVKVTRVNTYKPVGIANRLGAIAVPSVAFIRGGKFAGVLTEGTTREVLKAAL